MLKFFHFSETISGTTFFLRFLFTILLSLPFIFILGMLNLNFLIESGLDISDPSSLDSAMLDISENPEKFRSDLWSYVSTGWFISLIISIIPPIWFYLATCYKRITALFYENRKNLFASLVAFELTSDAIGLGFFGSLPEIVGYVFSIVSLLILIFLIFKNSKIDKDDHEG